MRRSRVRNPGAVAMLIGLMLATPAAAQQTTVRGTVVGADDSGPVASASVVVQGTGTGTLTNENGVFSIRVPSTATNLVVSRIGYVRQVVPLNGLTQIVVRMVRTTVALSDVVVVGYGTQARSDITGSVASVGTERLEEKPNVSISQAIEGATAGVTVTTTNAGAEPRLDIQVRGRNSISASTAPLVVVDGIPYNGNLAEINPSDIASIEILKDASATAIYGSRGSNGVLLVTSKKGINGKPILTYSAYTGTQRISNLPTLMNAQQFAEFKCVRIRTSPTQDCNSTLTATELQGLANGTDTDWERIGTRDGRQMQHDFSVSGGSDDTRYYLGGSLLNVDGVARNDQFDRVTVRLNLDQTLKSWLKVGTNTQVSRTNRDGMPVNFTTAFFSNPLISPYDANGNVVLVPWPEDPITNNALENLSVIDNNRTRRLFTSNYLRLRIPQIDGLSFTVNAGLDLANQDVGTYFGRDTQTGLTSGGQSVVSNVRRNDWTVENILGYNRVFGRHSIDLLALASEQSNDLEQDGVRGQGYPNDVLNYRSTLPLLAVPTSSVIESKLLSQMGRLNYGYDGRYLVTLTSRRDGYSGFGRNNKYGVFPSVALGWNVSNESFFPWKTSVDALKLRASYGRHGNQAIRPYRTLSQLDDRSYLNGDSPAPGYIPVSLGNPDLKWETTLSRNIGMDLSLWRGRINATLEAYRSNTSDLLLSRSISSVHGIDSVTQNIGKTSNKGFELQLGTVNVSRGSFRWGTDLNFAMNRNKIVDLYGDQTDDIGSGWFIGMPIDVNYGYKFAGIFQEGDDIKNSAQPTALPGYVRVVDVNGDGKIDPLDRTFIGSLQPKYTAGLTNTVRFSRFTLSAFVNTVQGVTRSNQLLGTNQVFTDVRRNTVFRTYWTPQTPINNYPSNSNSSNPLAVPFYEDASFIRLKDVSLSYDLPTGVARRLGGESLRLYVNGRNLWTKTEWTGLDPELTSQRNIPLEKIVTGGITVRF
ncbi:MAG: SusC/RagA family TonB-linked outer membrane protein [Gemmatimonadaceae bacterium]